MYSTGNYFYFNERESNGELCHCKLYDKKNIELKTPPFTTKYGFDDKYNKIKIHNDEIESFEKFIEFDQLVLHTDKTNLLINESTKKKSLFYD